MLDINYIKDNVEKVERSVRERGLEKTVNIGKLVKSHDSYIDLLQKVEQLRSKRNKISSEIPSKEGSEKEKVLNKAKKIKEELQDKEAKLKELRELYEPMLLLVPNVTSDDVPYGKDESENKVIKTWGKLPEFDFEPKNHMEIGEKLDLIDIETSGKVSGSRFNYLKNEAVILQFALINYVFDHLTDKEFISEIAKKTGNKYTATFVPILPPVIIKGDVAKKMDRFDPIDDRYYLEKDDQMLVGSAEHSIGPMHMDEIFSKDELPLRYIGYSTAFRREAGTYGKDEGGILRRHQFDKLEMESFSASEDGRSEQDLIVGIQEALVQKLNLPYQLIMLCTGDMGKPDYRQIDINCWMPGENNYRETHTSDYMTDFQSRRLNTRYKDNDGNTNFVHMNDATMFAIGRTLIAILENYQQKDGSVVVPEILRKYTGFDVVGKK